MITCAVHSSYSRQFAYKALVARRLQTNVFMIIYVLPSDSLTARLIHFIFSLLQERDQCWSFSQPVCLAGSVEAIWTPPTNHHGMMSSTAEPDNQHLLESLWLACGAEGIKVWLPLYPRDEGHPTFLSKRIMLTLPITVYPQSTYKLAIQVLLFLCLGSCSPGSMCL